MIKKICLVCKKSFQVHPCREKAKFCSRPCQHIAWGKKVIGKNHPMWKGGKVRKICKNCNTEFLVWKYRENTANYCSKKCNNTRPGERNNFWKGGKYLSEFGYVLIHKPNHPNCDSKGYIREHRYIMEQILGRFLTKYEVVHHINKIKNDNRPENLQIFENHSKHIKHHKNQAAPAVAALPALPMTCPGI